ncbi:CHAT domain-containing protein [Kamptonema formosum]|uniref:CHAT domain-containing protein n=1 Tax=Kamptonema formosum TaxID=331992 RepID=UPI00034D534F|nr:CHAT domain-containing protein [Oscillatoria sp. PCC 10802]
MNRIRQLLALLPFTALILSQPALAQRIVPAQDRTGTTVTPTGNQFSITGGSLSGDGANLFHSFQQFGLSEGQIANFLSSPNIRNILGRVAGGEPSVINGLIRVTGGNSNLYLINPAGILFGQNARLDVPASFLATTATGIGFGSNWFHAAGDNNCAALTGTPTAFAFPIAQPGAIVNNGELAVTAGNSLSLMGGTVLNTGTLSAPGGHLTLAAVPGESLVRISQPGHLLGLDIQTANLPAFQASNPPAFQPASLPALLTGAGAGHATAAQVSRDGSVILTGSGIKVEAGDVAIGNSPAPAPQVETGTLTLSAARNITLANTNLNATGTAQLQAGDTVRVRDTWVSAGGNLDIQGTAGIDLLSELSSFISAGSNLNLISNGEIYAGAHLSAGGDFSIRSLAGELGNFTSLDGSSISAQGKLTFGNYTGGSLSLYAGDSIKAGNITINPSERNLQPSLSLIAGVNPTAGNPATGSIDTGSITLSSSGGYVSLSAAGNLNTGSIGAGGSNVSLRNGSSLDTSSEKLDGRSIFISANGDIKTGDINAANTGGQGGVITIQSLYGGISTGTGTLSAGSVTGDAGLIDLRAAGNISTGNLNAASASEKSGSITLYSRAGAINTGSLNAGSQTGSGGAISLHATSGSIAAGSLNAASLSGSSGNINLYAGGNIATGDVAGGDISLASQSAINTSAGSVAASGNITLHAAGDIAAASVTSTGGNVRMISSSGGINTAAGSVQTNGGKITLYAAGNVTAGDLASDGGDIALASSQESVSTRAGKIDSSSASENGGNIILLANKEIAIAGIDSHSGTVAISPRNAPPAPVAPPAQQPPPPPTDGSATATPSPPAPEPPPVVEPPQVESLEPSPAPEPPAVFSSFSETVAYNSPPLAAAPYEQCWAEVQAAGILKNYAAAIQCFQKNVAAAGKVGNSQWEAQALNNLGVAYFQVGDYAKALESHQQQLALAQKLQNTSAKGQALLALATVYSALGNYEKAIEYYQQSLDSAPEADAAQWKGAALRNLGIVYITLEKYEQAIEFLQQALALAQKSGDRRGEGQALGNLGIAHFYLGDYRKAIEFSERHLAAMRQVGDRRGEAQALGNLGLAYYALKDYRKAIDFHRQHLAIARKIGDSPAEGYALQNLGEALHKNGQLQEAAETLRAGIDILESIRAGLGEDDLNKVSIFDRQVNAYAGLQEVLVAQDKTSEALEIAERGRARAFVELLAKRAGIQNSQSATVAPPNIERIKEIARAHNSTLVAYSIIQNPFEIEGRRQKLESDIYIWVVKPAGEVAFRRVELQSQRSATQAVSLEALVASSRDSIGVRGVSVVPRIGRVEIGNPSRQTKDLQRMYQLLIEPIADLLPANPNDRVTFIPQNELFLVPFAALQDAAGKYLIEKHTILTAPSIQVLDLTRRQNSKRGGDALVVGNPTMPSVPLQSGAPAQPLSQLPGAEREALEIAKLLSTEALTGNRATKQAILQRLSQARIVHLATHGLLDDLGSGVPGALALAPTGTDSGLLGAGEILDLKINADLVVLSACNTGKGRITGDGVIGLSRSFISAGTSSVLVSLWYVPDAPTAELMTEFYRQLQLTSDKAKALRNAMLATMKQHPDPREWAGFTLIGKAE